jgi:hypothetical protein
MILKKTHEANINPKVSSGEASIDQERELIDYNRNMHIFFSDN